MMPPHEVPLLMVFFRAALLAQQSGASEIGIYHLLQALDGGVINQPSVAQSVGPFLPVPHQDLPFSREAAAVLESLGDVLDMPLDRLRGALRSHRPE